MACLFELPAQTSASAIYDIDYMLCLSERRFPVQQLEWLDYSPFLTHYVEDANLAWMRDSAVDYGTDGNGFGPSVASLCKQSPTSFTVYEGTESSTCR